MKEIKWLNEVKQAFYFYNGMASLQEIYKYIQTHYSHNYTDDSILEGQLRRVIYQHSSDCDIYQGKQNLFMSENGKGSGNWIMRSTHELLNFDHLINLPIGALTTATDISKITGTNQVKGIHPISNTSYNISAVILCTINGENYPNEWIKKPDTLKYYLERTTRNKIAKYNSSIQSNQAVINSTSEKPIYVFVRENQKEKFTFYGKFISENIVTEADKGMYFVLQRLGKQIDISDLLISEDHEAFQEGKPKERMHKSRERNPRLIEEAKKEFISKHGKLFCEVCSFDFEKIYGSELGKDYIEAHHIIPVSELTENSTTKISDLLMVCANCHRMLHRKRPWIKENFKNILMN